MKPIERLHVLIKHYDMSISAFEKKAGLSNNSIQTAIKRNSNLKDETINTILNVYPEINLEWLLLGKGEMITGGKQGKDEKDFHLTYEKQIELLQQMNDIQTKYIKNMERELDELRAINKKQ